MNVVMRNFEEDFDVLVAQKEGDAALIYDDSIISYKELDFYIEKMLILFDKYQIKKGDVILSLLPNSPEALICFLATIKGGYGYAPLPCNATEREIRRWISLVDPVICVKKEGILEEVFSQNIIKRVENLKCDSDLHFLSNLTGDVKDSVCGKKPRLYLATSGTTGEPKAMVFDSNVLWSSGYCFGQFYGMKRFNPRIWNYLPVSYLGGLFNLCLIPLAMGGSIVITEPFSGKTFLNFWQMVKKYQINALWFVPTIVRGLLSIADMTKSSPVKIAKENIEIAFLGTAPIDLQTKEKFERCFDIKLLENFALSETTFFSAETLSSLTEREESSVGSILPYVEVRIDKMAETISWGEIKVKTPFLFLGYLGSDGKIYKEIDEGGFFSTGDQGYISENGTLIIKGRKEEVIKKGGLFVSLKEIELAIKDFHGLKESAAVRVQHDFYGESYVIFLKIDQSVDKHEIKRKLELWLHSNIVKYKWPEAVIIIDEFPRTSSGKIKKGELKKQYEQKYDAN